MPDTKTSSATTVMIGDEEVALPTGEDIYDALMGEIEPELLTVSIPTLDEKYKDETEEQGAARLVRYQEAYAKYDAAYAEWLSEFQGMVKDFRREALQSAEQESRSDEEKAMAKIESVFTPNV